jgi:hypothetical protein
MEKSLNQRYKDSCTTLSYKEWRRREDNKMASFTGNIPSPSLQDSTAFKNTQTEMAKITGLKTDVSNKTIFGINKYILIVAGVMIITAVVYHIYTKQKKP